MLHESQLKLVTNSRFKLYNYKCIVKVLRRRSRTPLTVFNFDHFNRWICRCASVSMKYSSEISSGSPYSNMRIAVITFLKGDASKRPATLQKRYRRICSFPMTATLNRRLKIVLKTRKRRTKNASGTLDYTICFYHRLYYCCT